MYSSIHERFRSCKSCRFWLLIMVYAATETSPPKNDCKDDEYHGDDACNDASNDGTNISFVTFGVSGVSRLTTCACRIRGGGRNNDRLILKAAFAFRSTQSAVYQGDLPFQGYYAQHRPLGRTGYTASISQNGPINRTSYLAALLGLSSTPVFTLYAHGKGP